MVSFGKSFRMVYSLIPLALAIGWAQWAVPLTIPCNTGIRISFARGDTTERDTKQDHTSHKIIVAYPARLTCLAVMVNAWNPGDSGFKSPPGYGSIPNRYTDPDPGTFDTRGVVFKVQ